MHWNDDVQYYFTHQRFYRNECPECIQITGGSKMNKLKLSLIAILLLIGSALSFNNAQAAGFSVTAHVDNTTPAIWHAAASVLHNTKDGSSFLGAGLCTTPRYDATISGYAMFSFASVCQYVSGTINANDTSTTGMAPITTTGGTLLGYDMFRWDVGGDVTGTRPGVFVGLTLSAPTTLGQ